MGNKLDKKLVNNDENEIEEHTVNVMTYNIYVTSAVKGEYKTVLSNEFCYKNINSKCCYVFRILDGNVEIVKHDIKYYDNITSFKKELQIINIPLKIINNLLKIYEMRESLNKLQIDAMLDISNIIKNKINKK